MPLLEEMRNSQETPKRIDRKESIEWPAMHDSTKWNQFDDDLENILNPVLHGGVEKDQSSAGNIFTSQGVLICTAPH